MVTIDPTAYTKVSVGYENNVWARGQVVVSLKAPNTESIVEYSKTHEKALVNRFSKRVVAIDEGLIISDGMDGYYTYEKE